MEYVALRDHGGGVVVLSADRPPANAMDVGLLGEVVEAVERLARDVPRALVLAGRPGFFSAGADLKAVPGYGPEQQRAMITGINRMALGVYELPCPVVGAITGHAIAGGLVLALCTDVRVASSEGRYGLTEVKVGVPYPQAAIGVAARRREEPGLGGVLPLSREGSARVQRDRYQEVAREPNTHHACGCTRMRRRSYGGGGGRRPRSADRAHGAGGEGRTAPNERG